MSEKIDNNFSLIDIDTKDARENFDLLVKYLCSKPVYNYDLSKVNREEPEQQVKLKKQNFMDCVNNVSKIIFDGENFNTALNVITNRTEFKEANSYSGFARIYDLNEPILLKIEGMHTYSAVSGLIHELTHIIQALNGNNPPKQYNEMLSIFAELIVIDYFSKLNSNEDIFNNHLMNRIINRMAKRVYSNNLYEDYDTMLWLKEIYYSNYTYYLGLIYSLRLFDLYKKNPKDILDDFNKVLSSKSSIIELLNKYNINLCDKDTLMCFYNTCDYYEEKVFEKYDKNEMHYVK